MAPNTERFKEAQRQAWGAPETVAAWRKWSRQFGVTTWAVTEANIQAAQVRPGTRLLDLASGAGER